MSSQRTVAKVTNPSIAEDYPRERLLEALDEGCGRPLIWVCGPGGAGQIHLLARYIENRDLHTIWYHVDHGDTDVVSFFHYLGLAAKRFTPGQDGSDTSVEGTCSFRSSNTCRTTPEKITESFTGQISRKEVRSGLVLRRF